MKNIEKLNRADIDFLSYQRDWEEFEQNNTSITLNVLFASYNSEEIKLAYKSKYNYKHKRPVILLMINDEAKKCLRSSQWLKSKKAAIINGDNDFQNALYDALNYQNIETHPERISKINPYITKYNWEGIEFPAGSKDWKKF